MKNLIKIIFSLLLATSCSAYAVIFEDWSPGQTQPGPISEAGIAWPTFTTTFVNITSPQNRWLVNTNQENCANNRPGPNACYAKQNGKLFFHGQHNSAGQGGLLISKQEFDIQNGFSVEGSFRAYCVNSSGCWVNIGIYDHEGNYRSIGFNSIDGTSAHLNIWGPCLEAPFNNTLPGSSSNQYCPGYESINRLSFGNKVLSNTSAHTYKLQHWKYGDVWRWDYFLDGIWVGGHNVTNSTLPGTTQATYPDKEFYLGPGRVSKPRIQLGYGGYPNGTAEGYFGTISFESW